jgi:putative nucleotidyltransferase with HDIG domain
MPSLVPASLLTLVHAVNLEHAQEVARLAREACHVLGLEADLGEAAGVLHDVGKLWVPRDVLCARRSLTSAEWALVRAHPVDGEGMVRHAWPDAPEAVLHAVRHHHERVDGSGYPDGLRALPLLTAVVAAADVYVALREDRSYRAALGVQAAREMVLKLALPEGVLRAVVQAAEQLERVSC